MQERSNSIEAKFTDEYYEASLVKPLHEVYSFLEPLLKPPGVAVDLGCGVGHATLLLLDKGFEVHAVDLSDKAIARLSARLPEGASVHLAQADMSRWPIPPCDVVTAGFSLFFLSPGQLDDFWQRLTKALKPGGLFAGQFLGVNDDWAARGYAVVDRAKALRMLEGFELIHFEEVERDGETTLKEPKHWHVFHIVARRLG